MNFYSDSGGTIPFNVSGLNFKVTIKEHSTTEVNGSSNSYDYYWLTSYLTGTSVKILDDFTWFEDYTDPDSGNTQSFTKTLSIFVGAYTIII